MAHLNRLIFVRCPECKCPGLDQFQHFWLYIFMRRSLNQWTEHFTILLGRYFVVHRCATVFHHTLQNQHWIECSVRVRGLHFLLDRKNCIFWPGMACKVQNSNRIRIDEAVCYSKCKLTWHPFDELDHKFQLSTANRAPAANVSTHCLWKVRKITKFNLICKNMVASFWTINMYCNGFEWHSGIIQFMPSDHNTN